MSTQSSMEPTAEEEAPAEETAEVVLRPSVANPFLFFEKVTAVWFHKETGSLLVEIRLRGDTSFDPTSIGVMWGTISFGDGTTYLMNAVHSSAARRQSDGHRRGGYRSFVARVPIEEMYRQWATTIHAGVIELRYGHYRWRNAAAIPRTSPIT